MKKSRFTEARLVGILKELDAGTPATELARKHGLHPNTIRLWREKHGGLETSDLVRLEQLEAENTQMQRIIACQTLARCAMDVQSSTGFDTVTNHGTGPLNAGAVTFHDPGIDAFGLQNLRELDRWSNVPLLTLGCAPSALRSG